MGTIQKGILGGFSGTVGSVIGGSWKGIDYMRSKASRRTITTTQKQKEQQLKFALIAKFQQPLANLLAISFKGYAVKMTGSNSAMSYNLRNGISGQYLILRWITARYLCAAETCPMPSILLP